MFLGSTWGSRLAWVGSCESSWYSSRISKNSSHNHYKICSWESHTDSSWAQKVWSIRGKHDQSALACIPASDCVCSLRRSKSISLSIWCTFFRYHTPCSIWRLSGKGHRLWWSRWHNWSIVFHYRWDIQWEHWIPHHFQWQYCTSLFQVHNLNNSIYTFCANSTLVEIFVGLASFDVVGPDTNFVEIWDMLFLAVVGKGE